MYLSSKLLLDSAISRRTFIQRRTAAGVSLTGAQAMAQSLLGSDAAREPLEASKVLQGLTGGELMAEFLIDWNIPYVFGLAGSEEDLVAVLVELFHLQVGVGVYVHDFLSAGLRERVGRCLLRRAT